MRAELPTVSFICVALLAGLVPAHWTAQDVRFAMLALIAWLSVCNLIQGVNAAVWAGNDATRITAWCDIVTKLTLGSHIAIPGACLSMCLHIQNSPFGSARRSRRLGYIPDIMFCIALPLFYIALHTIVQDHRFDIAADFGCSASTYTSIPAISLVWLPPTVLCISTLFFVAILGPRCIRIRHLQQASGISPYFTYCPLLISLLAPAILLSTLAFTLHSRIEATGVLPWSSWASVLSQFSTPNVIPPTAQTDLIGIQVVWWLVPACSVIVIVASLVLFSPSIVDETLSNYHVFVGRRNRQQDCLALKTIPSPPMCAPDELMKWSWDDATRSAGKPQPLHIVIPRSPSSASLPRNSGSSSDTATASSGPHVTTSPSQSLDETFVQSTLSYLSSPTARQALGVPRPHTPEPHTIYMDISASPAPVPIPPPRTLRRAHRPPPLSIHSGETVIYSTSSAFPAPSVPCATPVAAYPTPAVAPDEPSPNGPRRPSTPGSLLSGPWPRPPSAIPTPSESRGSPVGSVVRSPTGSVMRFFTHASPSRALRRVGTLSPQKTVHNLSPSDRTPRPSWVSLTSIASLTSSFLSRRPSEVAGVPMAHHDVQVNESGRGLRDSDVLGSAV
ncbi:B mating type receptor [Gelatoporia subvermispora B]|uniref:B mating type receptor n=1 Tax=Ceriporiopsis subvermispora (strain B) TaxID=914234 RepID=M2R9W4_CERS8|nr:B mating type receptor [Gelatoporia subvermispora B]